MCATLDSAPDMTGTRDEEEMQSKLSHRREKWGEKRQRSSGRERGANIRRNGADSGYETIYFISLLRELVSLAPIN